MSIKVKSILLIVLVLLIDQASKIYIKLNFALGENVEVFSWFYIYFIENNGMAFGLEIINKLFLTLFRLVAASGLAYYIYYLIKKGTYSTGYILSISLMMAGATGNIFDSLLYGILFDSSVGQVATFLPDSGGYAPLFYGKVVDMFYFPIITNAQGQTLFFNPVFNVADSAISLSVIIILLFFRKEFNESLESKKDKDADIAQ
jgi:signal peptidase II